jgi:acyl carrier protein
VPQLNADTYARTVDLLADVLMIDDPATVTPEAHLVKDLGAESINFAEITVAVEDEFGLTVDGPALQQVATVQALSDYIEGLRQAQG